MGTYSDPALILPGTVGQTELDAASKKDVVGGVAALDASGFVLAKGAGIAFPRSGSDDVHIYERTAGEEAYAFHRVGADDYTFYIKESNVWKRFQTESMKNVANGIAGLDAASKVLIANLPDDICRRATSNYTGNGGTNLAIPHGLGVIPKAVISVRQDNGINSIGMANGKWGSNYGNETSVITTTAMDSTNFYVSGWINGNTNVYEYAVIA